ncbi:hypothetical protein ACIBEJ_50550 [Nonomuraea sp. NPDC050790]|uniref:hypothetical protein n=1 Tax=Nonomuraea sp. NPDC050790 TaxID=3364371 RepID=UPI0037BD9DDE
MPIDANLVARNGRLTPKAAKNSTAFSRGGIEPLVEFTDDAADRTIRWPAAAAPPVVTRCPAAIWSTFGAVLLPIPG